jgi:hypothetical protein
MWRAIGSSVVGTSHQKLQTPCQDFCDYYSCFLGSDRVFLIGIADGAGSASASDIGSEEAVRHVLQSIARSGLSLFEINEKIAADWLLSTRERLDAVAHERKIPVRELACTTLVAILGESCAVFVQVGDGAWIAHKNGTYEAVTWPSGGEYANQTTFITSPNWREVMQFRVVREALSAVAGFSDGLQSLALHIASRSVHAPFFDSKFKALEAADDETNLRAPLIEFLSSPALVARTDDDKTLVLACRRDLKLLGPPSETSSDLSATL